MKQASVTYTKNNLSRILNMVREGATVLIVDRDVPVARVEPISPATAPTTPDSVRSLERRGIVAPPRRALDVPRFLARARISLPAGASAVRLLLEEREDSP